MLTTQEAAKLLGVSDARVRELIAQKQLPASKVGRAWLLRDEDVMARLLDRPQRGRPKAKSGVGKDPNDFQVFCKDKGQETDWEERALQLHETYELCRKLFLHFPSRDEYSAIQNDEERAFRVALHEFFLQQKQQELIKQGAF